MRTLIGSLVAFVRRLRARRDLHRHADIHGGAAERMAGHSQAAMHAARHHAGPHGGSGGV